jgi:hypothetical protein
LVHNEGSPRCRGPVTGVRPSIFWRVLTSRAARFGLLEPRLVSKAAVYGTEGQRFESSRARSRSPANAGLSRAEGRSGALAVKCRTTLQDRSALAAALVGSLAHESLDVGAEEPDVPAEIDPAQHAGAPPVEHRGHGHREEGSDLAGLHDVVAGEPSRWAVRSQRAHALNGCCEAFGCCCRAHGERRRAPESVSRLSSRPPG